MFNTKFHVSFFDRPNLVKVTIHGNIKKVFEFQEENKIFPYSLVFVDDEAFVAFFSKQNGGKLVEWLQKNGALYQK